MALHVIEVWAWVCDSCGIECVDRLDRLPEGWELMGSHDTQDGPEDVHWCAVCTADARSEVPC